MMKIEVTQCSMCTHYNTEQYCEVWEQYITNDAFYCACGVKADRKDEPQKPTYNPTSANNLWEKPTNPYVETMSCQECKHHNGNDGCDVMTSNIAKCKYEPKDEPQTDCAWREP